MPMQQSKSKISFGKALRGAVEKPVKAKSDFSSLPGGISGGVAKVASAAIGVYAKGANQGQRFLRLVATVVKPKVAVRTTKVWESDKDNPRNKKGVVVTVATVEEDVYGRQTSVMYPLCETKGKDRDGNETVNGIQDNIDRAINDLKLFMGEETVAEVCAEHLTDDRDETFWKTMEQLCAVAKESGPYIQFNTRDTEPTERYPNSRTFETWIKGVPDFGQNGDGEAAGMLEDSTGGGGGNDGGTDAETQTEDDGSGNGGDGGGNVATEADDQPDLHATAELADQETETDEVNEARARLEDWAKDNGIEESRIKKAPNWGAVAAMIEAALSGDAGGGQEVPPEDDEPQEPQKGDTFSWFPPDPRTKKPGKKAVQVQAVAVNAAKRTADIKNLTTKAVIKGVKWDDLQPPA